VDMTQRSFGARFGVEPIWGEEPQSVRGLGGRRVELFGRGEAFVSCLHHQLPFCDHVHEFNTDSRSLRIVYLSPTDKYPRLTSRLSQNQKGLSAWTKIFNGPAKS
jgi:hypothetical protein